LIEKNRKAFIGYSKKSDIIVREWTIKKAKYLRRRGRKKGRYK